ncbi:MAG: LacI family DNA-binding transcriptional regulator [Capsulimonadales bacterium]|nr:LacI family DNA-binding transcriptional regulator [Capsulimonadales bacterium]
MSTIRDVAKSAGISVAAASAVLNGNGSGRIRVSPATRQRIYEAAEALSYRPNHLARGLATGRKGIVGLVFPYPGGFFGQDPFCSLVMTGVFEEVAREKHNIMLHTATGDGWNTAEPDDLIDSRIDGLLLVLPMPESPVIAACRRLDFPYVALAYNPTDPEVLAVNADEFRGGSLATEHLIALGHRRIAHLSWPEYIATSHGRRAGYEWALREAGLPSMVVPTEVDREGGYRAMSELLDGPADRHPTAVFAASDLCAEGAIRAIRHQGRRVPDDIAVVGYDDTWFAGLAQPKLTSVRMPIAEMGRTAAEMLIALIEGRPVVERQPILPVSLTVRDSCGATAAPA